MRCWKTLSRAQRRESAAVTQTEHGLESIFFSSDLSHFGMMTACCAVQRVPGRQNSNRNEFLFLTPA